MGVLLEATFCILKAHKLTHIDDLKGGWINKMTWGMKNFLKLKHLSCHV